MTQSDRPKPIVLLILDGWGISNHKNGNAITMAATPTLDSFLATYPHTTLEASGEAVGLPHGEDGNTETGHLNIGAGQIVYQDLPRINQAIADGSFFQNREFLAAINHVKTHQSTIHIAGLVGSGGVHSSLEHLYALLNLCKQQSIIEVSLHLFTDGRDSPPTSGINYISQIKARLKELGIGRIASVMGRYYAMDRDHRWERTEVAYLALTRSQGTLISKPEPAILESYKQNITDEFIKPHLITDENNQVSLVKENDAFIFFNFRIDRPRQLTKAFVYPNLEYVNVQKEGFDPYAIKYHKTHLPKPAEVSQQVFDRGPLIKNLYFVTMTEYEKGLPAHIAFPPQLVDMPVGRVVAEMGLRQLRMAETEKERFVTFYLNGQREDPFPGEDRIIIPSPPVPTYDQKPEMSSLELTQTLIERIQTNLYDLIIVNYANADMVAHTGNLEATIIACQVIDENVKHVTDQVNALGGVTLITADHGNAEEMINLETGVVDTEHSAFPVPLIIVGPRFLGQNIQLPQ
jgi:2,3-bisphosphoglycerate-independent phosphoglycerate mutase